jgi:hypothetical protein
MEVYEKVGYTPEESCLKPEPSTGLELADPELNVSNKIHRNQVYHKNNKMFNSCSSILNILLNF